MFLILFLSACAFHRCAIHFMRGLAPIISPRANAQSKQCFLHLPSRHSQKRISNVEIGTKSKNQQNIRDCADAVRFRVLLRDMTSSCSRRRPTAKQLSILVNKNLVPLGCCAVFTNTSVCLLRSRMLHAFFFFNFDIRKQIGANSAHQNKRTNCHVVSSALSFSYMAGMAGTTTHVIPVRPCTRSNDLRKRP